ncbi:MAG: transglutaminase-like domain-containing protein [Propionibacteriaceae bacterium]|nr:transglutaminase-like domain-containing protein [Propionibacteriaceae bacterium]
MTDQRGTDVNVHIEALAQTPAELVFSVAVAHGPVVTDEIMALTVGGEPIDLTEVAAPDGGRLHVARIPAGPITFDYRATTDGSASAEPVSGIDEIEFRRPSRYAESDKLGIIASKRFAGLEGQEQINAIADWVHDNLFYVSGSSAPTDGAVDTYLAQQGVCRDFAHLTIAMLRACGFPARLVAVYAPGLDPMDFHAVAEVAHEGRWQVVDATRMAPRQSLVRIVNGRDASDTAFLTVQSGQVEFGDVQVMCVRHEGLPTEDPEAVVHLGSTAP